ncbi:MAG: hypothetical protein ABJJ44_05985 [Paraglaciecola sp.]|uniref:hypothetical protein n=1 Tax=Paraglaciecola sp. TaxID=1920173 RepID=UPI0032997B3A
MNVLKKVKNKVKNKLDTIGVPVDYAEICIDKLDVNVFRGWARKVGDQGNVPCTVKLCQEERIVAQGKANDYRDDLHDLGYGNGCLGFSLTVDWRALDVGENKLTLYVDDKKVRVVRITLGIPDFIGVAIKEHCAP